MIGDAAVASAERRPVTAPAPRHKEQRIGGINEVAEVLVEFVDGSIGWLQAYECLLAMA